MLTAVNPPNASWPGISQGVILQGKGIFMSSGHVPMDEQGNLVTGDFESQVIAVFESLKRTLRAAGLTFESVARVVTYVTDYEPSMIDVIKKVRSRYYNLEKPPASVLIAAAALYDPRIKLEVEIVAVLP
jgi:2-iminobutanoate/2-iminopropanoate deaminase